MTTWLPPHVSKVYEAISAIADSRITIVAENIAHCTSTSRGKFYTVTFDPGTNSIMSNDNTAYYTGSVSYPMIAMLMLKNIIVYDSSLLPPLKGVLWKDLNVLYNNDYDEGIAHYFRVILPPGYSEHRLRQKIDSIYQNICSLQLSYLGPKIPPPKAY